MSLLRAEKRAKHREAKVSDPKALEALPHSLKAEQEQSEKKPSRPRRNWGKVLSSPRLWAWVANLCLIGWIGYAWVGRHIAEMRERQLATEVAYRVNRFTTEIATLEKMKNLHADFILPVGEAPYLMRGELHLLWESPPTRDVAFLWQNDHFARRRGVVVVSTNRKLLQEVDAMLDDGDLGNGLAQMHPRGLWISLLK